MAKAFFKKHVLVVFEHAQCEEALYHVFSFSAFHFPAIHFFSFSFYSVWTPELQRDFDELKRLMSMEPILRCPDEEKEFLLQTGASDRGIAAVLSQVDEDGVDRPVAYYTPGNF